MVRYGSTTSLLAAAAASVSFALSPHAYAAGGWLAGAPLTPTEQRVAIAVSPARTTLWTSLRFNGTAGTVAIVVPAPRGSSVDLTSDAWFEALEGATAPRIFPPQNTSGVCAEASGSAASVEVSGQLGHRASLPPEEVALLDDVPSVTAWASKAGLTVSPALGAALTALGSVRFVALRFQAAAGANVTPTVRVVMPGAPSTLPLMITRAGTADLHVTSWIFGPGRAHLMNATEVVVPANTITWSARAGASSYEDARAAVLAVDPDAFLIEAAGHEALANVTPWAEGGAVIDDVVTTFFERAAAYGDGSLDVASCMESAVPSLGSPLPVADSCPRSELGVMAPAVACLETPTPGSIDPDALRCGPGADDLAVALSGMVPSAVWITRHALTIDAREWGTNGYVEFTPGEPVSPVVHAGTVDSSGCAVDAGPLEPGVVIVGNPTSTPVFQQPSVTSGGGTGVDPGADTGGSTAVDTLNAIAAVANAASSDTSCGCSGTDTATTEASSDSCSGGEGSSDSCSGGEGSSEGCSGGDGGGDSCGSSGGGGESCSGGDGGESCGGGGSDFKCATSAGRIRSPKLSALVLSALTVIAPLRRRGRRSRRDRRS